MSKVAILGASGFIGSAIVGKAASDPQITKVLALQHRQAVAGAEDGRVEILQGSLSELPAQIFEADDVFHAARQASSNGRMGRLFRSVTAQVKNRQLLARFDKADTHVWYLSGSLMYGSSTQPIDEAAPINPLSYGRLYQYAEQPFLKRSQRSPKVHIIRVPWVFGRGSWFERFYLEPMLGEGHVPLYGKGDNTMTFIDREDLGTAVLGIAAHKEVPVANLFMNDYLKQADFAALLHSFTGLPVRSYSEEAIKAKGGILLLEAFNSNIRLSTCSDHCAAVLSANRFCSVEEMLKVRLPEFGF